jgi:hypothetical protein
MEFLDNFGEYSVIGKKTIRAEKNWCSLFYLGSARSVRNQLKDY